MADCVEYVLDISGRNFGDCKCGSSKATHPAKAFQRATSSSRGRSASIGMQSKIDVIGNISAPRQNSPQQMIPTYVTTSQNFTPQQVTPAPVKTTAITPVSPACQKILAELEIGTVEELKNEIQSKKSELAAAKKDRDKNKRRESLNHLERNLEEYLQAAAEVPPPTPVIVVEGLEKSEFQSAYELQQEIRSKKEKVTSAQKDRDRTKQRESPKELKEQENGLTLSIKQNLTEQHQEKNKDEKKIGQSQTPSSDHTLLSTNLSVSLEPKGAPRGFQPRTAGTQNSSDLIHILKPKVGSARKQTSNPKKLDPGGITLSKDCNEKFMGDTSNNVFPTVKEKTEAVDMNSGKVSILDRDDDVDNMFAENDNNHLDIEKVVKLVHLHKSHYLKLRDQKIVLLLGETGAGKSTTINFLAGKSFQKHTTGSELMCDDCLSQFKIGHDVVSETRYLQSLEIEGLKLCDAPGFCDTSGPNVAISNAIAITNVLKNSLSVVILVLIPLPSMKAGRGNLFRKLMEVMFTFMPTLISHMNSIVPIFTRDDAKQGIEFIKKTLEKEKVKLEFNKQPDLLLFLDHLIANIDLHGPNIIVHPETQTPENLLQRLKSATYITNVDEFSLAITNENVNDIEQYCVDVERKVETALQQDSLQDACVLLKRVSIFADETGLPRCKDVYNRAFQKASTRVSYLYQQAGDAIESDDFDFAKRLYRLLSSFQNFGNFSESVLHLQAKISVKCESLITQLTQLDADVPSFVNVVRIIEQLQSAMEEFLPSEWKSIRLQAIEKADSRVSNLAVEATDLIELGRFSDVAVFDQLIQFHAMKVGSIHEDRYDKMCLRLNEVVRSHQQKLMDLEENLKNPGLCRLSVPQTAGLSISTMQTLVKVKDKIGHCLSVSLDNIDKILDSIFKLLTELIQTVRSMINDSMKDSQLLSTIARHVDQIRCLCWTIDHLPIRMAAENLFNEIETKRKKALAKIQNNDDNQKLAKYLTDLLGLAPLDLTPLYPALEVEEWVRKVKQNIENTLVGYSREEDAARLSELLISSALPFEHLFPTTVQSLFDIFARKLEGNCVKNISQIFVNIEIMKSSKSKIVEMSLKHMSVESYRQGLLGTLDSISSKMQAQIELGQLFALSKADFDIVDELSQSLERRSKYTECKAKFDVAVEKLVQVGDVSESLKILRGLRDLQRHTTTDLPRVISILETQVQSQIDKTLVFALLNGNFDKVNIMMERWFQSDKEQYHKAVDVIRDQETSQFSIAQISCQIKDVSTSLQFLLSVSKLGAHQRERLGGLASNCHYADTIFQNLLFLIHDKFQIMKKSDVGLIEISELLTEMDAPHFKWCDEAKLQVQMHLHCTNFQKLLLEPLAEIQQHLENRFMQTSEEQRRQKGLSHFPGSEQTMINWNPSAKVKAFVEYAEEVSSEVKQISKVLPIFSTTFGSSFEEKMRRYLQTMSNGLKLTCAKLFETFTSVCQQMVPLSRTMKLRLVCERILDSGIYSETPTQREEFQQLANLVKLYYINWIQDRELLSELKDFITQVSDCTDLHQTVLQDLFSYYRSICDTFSRRVEESSIFVLHDVGQLKEFFSSDSEMHYKLTTLFSEMQNKLTTELGDIYDAYIAALKSNLTKKI